MESIPRDLHVLMCPKKVLTESYIPIPAARSCVTVSDSLVFTGYVHPLTDGLYVITLAGHEYYLAAHKVHRLRD